MILAETMDFVGFSVTKLFGDYREFSSRMQFSFPLVFAKKMTALPLGIGAMYHFVRLTFPWISGQGILGELLY